MLFFLLEVVSVFIAFAALHPALAAKLPKIRALPLPSVPSDALDFSTASIRCVVRTTNSVTSAHRRTQLNKRTLNFDIAGQARAFKVVDMV